jgi:hypothetical protein
MSRDSKLVPPEGTSLLPDQMRLWSPQCENVDKIGAAEIGRMTLV